MLFFIEHGTRRVHLAGITVPNGSDPLTPAWPWRCQYRYDAVIGTGRPTLLVVLVCPW